MKSAPVKSDSRVKRFIRLLVEMGFLQTELLGVAEKVFERQIAMKKGDTQKAINVWVRVYTTINFGSGTMREEGTDAIRIQAIKKFKEGGTEIEKILWAAKDTRRTPNWGKVLARVKKRARIAWLKGIARRKTPLADPDPSVSPPTGDEKLVEKLITENQREYYKQLTGDTLPVSTYRRTASEMIANAKKQQTEVKPKKKFGGKKLPGDDPTPSQLSYLRKMTGEDWDDDVDRLHMNRKDVSTMIDTVKTEFESESEWGKKREVALEAANDFIDNWKRRK